jgi:hypothetical protein
VSAILSPLYCSPTDVLFIFLNSTANRRCFGHFGVAILVCDFGISRRDYCDDSEWCEFAPISLSSVSIASIRFLDIETAINQELIIDSSPRYSLLIFYGGIAWRIRRSETSRMQPK